MAIERCLGCMKPKSPGERCQYCGFFESDIVTQDVLPPQSQLQNRYLVGKAIKVNGEGITYLGFDQQANEPVFIREYMPSNLCSRVEESLVLGVGCEAKYKALQSDFIELYQHLVSLKHSNHIVHVINLFRQNNTVYAIISYFESMTLTQYVNDNAGELSFEVTAKLFRPLLETLSMAHKLGVIHRGISPDTIVVSNNRLLLTEFAICSLRMSESEIDSQLYPGYAAPEQYASTLHHGTWTDVYGVCAVLYKALSGTMPSEASTRAVNDNLIALNRLNQTVPSTVSGAIELGMMYDATLRTATIVELITNLYMPQESTGNASTMLFGGTVAANHRRIKQDDSAVIYSDSKREQQAQTSRREQQGQMPPKPPQTATIADTYHATQSAYARDAYDEDDEDDDKMPAWQKAVLVLVPVVIVAILGLYWLLVMQGHDDNTLTQSDIDASASLWQQAESSLSESPNLGADLSEFSLGLASSSSSLSASESESSTLSEAIEETVVADFLGQKYQDVIVDAAYSKRFKFAQEEGFSSSFPEAGVVIEQSILAGKKVPMGTEILLTVSKGPRYVDIPSENELASYKGDDLQAMLENKYIKAIISPDAFYSNDIPVGHVVSIGGVLPGTRIDREVAPDATVIIFLSQGPDPSQFFYP